VITKKSNPEKRVCAQKEKDEHKHIEHVECPPGPMPQSAAVPPWPRVSNLLIPGVETLLTEGFFARKFTITVGTIRHVLGVGIRTA